MNDIIEQARQVALSILKPTPSELEHGLELHRQSLVVESYGFSPRGPANHQVLQNLAQQAASPTELRDEATRMSLAGMLISPQASQHHRDVMDFAGVDCVFQNAGEEGQSPLQMLKRLGHFTYVLDMLDTFMQRAARPDDILKARQAGKHSLYLTTNGVPLLQQWDSVQEELSSIRTFFELGVRMMHVTYNRRNMLGDGCQERANGGLSDFGIAAVQEMNRVGVIVDVAHSGWQTSIDAARVSSQPIVASHTVAHALSNHRRGKTDEVMRAIVDGGGTIGICCIPAFLGGTGDINAMLDHIDYVAKKFGTDSVTIGTDVAYVPQPVQLDIDRPAPPLSRSRFENFWPPEDPRHDPYWGSPQMRQSMAWTNWPLFTVGMVKRGYSDQDIQKILGGNIMRVAKQVFCAASPLPTCETV